MRAPFTLPLVVLMVLAVVPGWTGETRLGLLRPDGQMTATRVMLDPGDPARSRAGRLTYLGGVALDSRDPAFGGYSALAVQGDRFTLLSDGGNVVRFRMGADWQPRDVRFSNLPAGPGTGWEKSDRDSESLAIGPDGRTWVGFENSNAIWRYTPGFGRAEAWARPRGMRRWDKDGGPELFTRLPDGRFLTVSESTRVPARAWRGTAAARRRTRDAILFAGDPTVRGTAAVRLGYVPMAKYDPVDAAVLPEGGLLVLERRFAAPFRWSNRLAIVPAGAIRAGRLMQGRTAAMLAAPLIHDNFEGVAAVREGGRTIVWLVSDDNQWPFQRSLLLKFRLDAR